MADLDAAKLDDVKDWFRANYGAANAVLTVAGDVHPDSVLAKVQRYFGDIPSGPPVTHQETWIAKRTGHQRGVMEDRVPQARIYRVWNVPEWGSADGDYLAWSGQVLTAGKSSRLFKRLVYDEQIATDVSAYADLREIGGLFVVQASARPGVEPAKVERALDQELARLLASGPTPPELARARARIRAGFIRGVERIGGDGGKSDVLARGQVFTGRPDAYKERMRRFATATPAQVRAAAVRWLSDGDYTLEVRPFPEYRTATTGADRSHPPAPGAPPATQVSRAGARHLSNGLKVVLAERRAIPQIRFDLLLDAGFAADQSAVPGTASMTMAMLDEGTEPERHRDQRPAGGAGAILATGSRLDVSSVSLAALRDEPRLRRSPSTPMSSCIRRFPPPTSSGSGASDWRRSSRRRPIRWAWRCGSSPACSTVRVTRIRCRGPARGRRSPPRKLTRDDLIRFHRTWFKPNHATLVVVGATTMAEIRPKLERLFARWEPGEVPAKNIGTVAQQPRSTVYLLDRPDAIQSLILVGNVAPPKANPDEPAIETMNQILGGTPTARLNLNLREDKHWSYGSFSFFRDARGQRPFMAYAPVQTDKTVEALAELRKELSRDRRRAAADGGGAGPGPIVAHADAAGKLGDDGRRRGVDRRYRHLRPGRPLLRRLRRPGPGPDPGDRRAAARETIHPDRLVWVVVGDRAKIEQGVRNLGLGEIRLIDADGKPLGPT